MILDNLEHLIDECAALAECFLARADAALARAEGFISGIAVNLAARVEERAGNGELWASCTVRDMLFGGDATFEQRGEHELKGIDGTGRLCSVAAK